jgi:hypothetical protein
VKATLLAMALALPVLAIILARGRTPGRMLAALALCVAAPPGALALMLGAAELVGMGESAGALFAKKALGSLGEVASFGWAVYAAKAGLLVGALTFQAHPLFQRLLVSGYHMGHSRARYGLPLVPSLLLLSYPGMAALAGRYAWARWIPAAIVAANVGVWGLFALARLAAAQA